MFHAKPTRGAMLLLSPWNSESLSHRTPRFSVSPRRISQSSCANTPIIASLKFRPELPNVCVNWNGKVAGSLGLNGKFVPCAKRIRAGEIAEKGDEAPRADDVDAGLELMRCPG